jgi:hypothetical protein
MGHHRGLRRQRRHAIAILVVRAEHAGAARLHPERDRIGAEAGEDRHVHRADLPRPEHDRDGLRYPRQEAGDPIASGHAERDERAGEPVREAGQLVEAEGTLGAALAEPSERAAIGAGVTLDQRLREIDGPVRRPAERLEARVPREAGARLEVGGTLDARRRIQYF